MALRVGLLWTVGCRMVSFKTRCAQICFGEFPSYRALGSLALLALCFPKACDLQLVSLLIPELVQSWGLRLLPDHCVGFSGFSA